MSERRSACGVEEFLELEAEPSSGTKRTETYEQGNIAGVAKIPAADVPDGYPVSIETQQALHLDVETPEGETVATYIEWPDGDEDSEAQRASNASGEQGDPVSENAAVVMFGYGWWFVPVAVYFDAEYVGDANDWDPMSGLWAVVAFFTWIFGTGAYLLRRNRMTD